MRGHLVEPLSKLQAANPVVGILLGVALFDERLSRPSWHVVVACVGLGLALVGAVVISLAREGAGAEDRPARAAPDAVTA